MPMQSGMTDKKASKPRAPRPQDLELESMRIGLAENGWRLDIERRVKRDRRRDIDGWPEPEHLVFTNARELLAAIGSKLGIKVKSGE